MARLRIAPIVEGHGEIEAVGILLRRLVAHLCFGRTAEILKPIRVPRSKLVKNPELERALRLARMKLDQAVDEEAGLVLVLFDADQDKPCVLAPELQKEIRVWGLEAGTSLVLAEKEYESWFVAAADSLGRFLDLAKAPNSGPEVAGKGWIEKTFRGPKYSETVDQPKLTAAMDLDLCRQKSKSFDKLCREIERFVQNHPA